MDITYTYNITKLYTLPNYEEFERVVKKVDWNIIGSYSDISITLSGSTKLPDPSPDDFIDFLNLTETQIISWILNVDPETQLLKDHVRVLLEKELEIKGLDDSLGLPWNEEVNILKTAGGKIE